jgi:dolichyl-diphosphooligosaccharide--protein glycosyltransferase
MALELREILWEKIRGIDRKQAFLLLVLFLFAFGVRAHLAKYELLFGFDSYYHARMNSYMIESGSVPSVDSMSWYSGPEGGAPLPGGGQFFWFFNAMMYKLLTLGAPYDKELWINIVKILPALYGALISIAMFFFGKELYDRRAGYVMAFFAAVVPAFVYRTMGGFLEEDALGFLWMVLGLVFFAKAIKEPEFSKEKILYAATSGILFGLMAFTWQMFLLIPLVLAGYLVFAAINTYAEGGLKRIVPFAGLFGVSMGVFAAITTFVDSGVWIERSFNYLYYSVPASMAWLVFGGGIALLMLVCYLVFLGEKSKSQSESTGKTIKLIAMLMLFGTLLLLVTIIVTAPNMWEASGVLGKSVGEESPGRNYFGEKYNALIALPALALLLIPWMVYRKKKDHLSILVFFWIFATFFMAWYKLKFTYTFGLPIAAAAGVIVTELFHFLRNRTEFEKKSILLALGFMFLVGVAAGSLFVEDKVPSIEQPLPDWKSALNWMREETPQDAKIFNWWDYGHWISFVGERAVLTDNRNLYLEPLQDVAKFIITPDLNEALRIVKSYGSDYVILSYDNFQKLVSYSFYAFNTMNADDPRILPYRAGPNVALVCNTAVENNETKLVCGSNVLNHAQASALKRDWSNQPNQLFENRIPMFIYLDKDNYAMYALSPSGNSSTLAKLWFHNPDAMLFFEEVYGKRGIKVFRVKKDALATLG